MTLAIRLLGPIQISRADQPVQMRGYQAVSGAAGLFAGDGPGPHPPASG